MTRRLCSLTAVFFLLFFLLQGTAFAREVIGQNETLLTAMNGAGARGEECALGDLTADAVRDAAGTDIALIPGGAFAFNLLGGDVTEDDIALIFPEDDVLGVTELTAGGLWTALERSVSALVLSAGDRIDWDRSRSDGFLQISGLTFRFDVSNEPGERILEITLADGRVLNPEDETTRITAASTAAFLSGGYGYPAQEWTALDLTLPEAFARYVRQQDGPLRAPAQDRIARIGSADSAFLSGMTWSAFIFLGCAGVIALTGALTFGRSIAWKALKDRAMPETEEEKKSPLDRFLRH